MFVASVREICEACRGTGVKFLLEPYAQTLLDGPRALRRAFEAIDRPGLVGLNFDLVNLVTVERYYDIPGLIDEVVETVGQFVESLHVKDVRYRTDLSLRLDEVTPGEGQVDFVHWFRRVDALGRDIPAYIEHLRTFEQMMAAWPVVRAAAVEAGALAHPTDTAPGAP
jgi:sugar phosphate isomerase/epimerase